MTVPYLPLRAQYLGHHSASYLSLAMLALALSSVFSSAGVGWLVQRVPPVYVFTVACTVRVLGYIAFGVADGKVSGVVSLVLLGIGNGLLLASLPLVVGSLPGKTDRLGRLAVMNALFNVGMGLGAVFSAISIVVSQQPTHSATIYFFAAALSLWLPILCLRVNRGHDRGTRHSGDPESATGDTRGGRPTIPANVAMVNLFAVGILVAFLAYPQVDVGLPVLGATAFPTVTWIAGAVLAVNTIAVVVLQVVATKLLRRWTPPSAVRVGVSIWASAGLLSLAVTFWVGLSPLYLAVYAVFFAAGEVLVMPALTEWAFLVTKSAGREGLVAHFSSVSSWCSAGGNASMAVIAANVSAPGFFLLGGIVPLVSILLIPRKAKVHAETSIRA